MRFPACLVPVLILIASPIYAHEFWIEPEKFQVPESTPLSAHLRNGEFFAGVQLAYFETRTARFDLFLNGQPMPYTGRMGDVPALQLEAVGQGLLVITHQTRPDRITHHSWDKFARFAADKGFADIQARHFARDLPQDGFAETYTRFAKSLVGVGSAQGTDLRTGFETEFVALANPYADSLTGMLPVRLDYQGSPRADAQVDLFERAPDGVILTQKLRTDGDGLVQIPVKPGHAYQLDAVVLRPAPAGDDAVWETLWANLTFAVPAR